MTGVQTCALPIFINLSFSCLFRNDTVLITPSEKDKLIIQEKKVRKQKYNEVVSIYSCSGEWGMMLKRMIVRTMNFILVVFAYP